MNHQHHLKSDPKFGRFGRFSRGADARGGARGNAYGYAPSDDHGGALGHGRKAFGGSCGKNFRVAIHDVSGVSNPGC